MRADLEDVQIHPVKKHLLIKFKTQQARDDVAERLAGEGLEWPEFHTKVQGWAMDKPVMFVRILGSSPLTTKEEIKQVMQQYGDIIEVKKGFLSRKLPNVTNGTWTVRLVVGEGKTIPSFVFVQDDGEIWQLVHDSQDTICWICGGKGHIGGRCRQQAVSIDDDLVAAPDAQDGGVAPAQTWAHVVRRGAGHHVPQTAAAQEEARVEAARVAQQAEEDARVEGERVETARVAQQAVEDDRVEDERIETARVKQQAEEDARVEVERVETARVAQQVEEDARIEGERVETARIENARVVEANRVEADMLAVQAEDTAKGSQRG